MTRFILRAAVAALVGMTGFSSVAFAQDTNNDDDSVSCTCTTGNDKGKIVSVVGDVKVAQTSAFQPAAAGDPIAVDYTVMVGAQSEASIRVGTCRLTLPENTTTQISSQKGAICIATASAAAGGAIAVGGAAGLGTAGLIAGGLIIGGSVAIIAESANDDGDDRPVSFQN